MEYKIDEQKSKGDFERQQNVLRKHCGNAKLLEFSDVTCGMNTKRRGLIKMMDLIKKARISEVMVTYWVVQIWF